VPHVLTECRRIASGWKIFLRAAFAAFLIASMPAAAADESLNAGANAAFLAANRTKAGVITRPSGLQYRILHSGFGKRPGPSDTVSLNYTGRLINGTVFDGSSPGLPATFAVNGVIPGLSEALQLMHEGDRWQIVVPPNLGFGLHGSANGSVPPGQVLVFDLALVSASSESRPEAETPSPLSIGASDRGQKAVLTIHP
jgi:FKBP-type peptidyl-prolyl cis-trans isomerase